MTLLWLSTWCVAAGKDSDPGLPISTTHTFYSLKSTYFLSLYLNLTHRGGKYREDYHQLLPKGLTSLFGFPPNVQPCSMTSLKF